MVNKVSIIIPCRNEEQYIEKCIDSILNSDFDTNNMEILVVDGMSNDNTRDIIKKISQKNSIVRLLDNPNFTVPYAMNIGIEDATADIIIRLDAHAEFPNNYISELLRWQEKLDADNIGGVVQTLPSENTLKSKAIALALSSGFGVGNSYFRIGSDKPMKVDTVPFGCYKKKTLIKIGLYDVELTRNQDDELNARLIEKGGTIWLIPEIKIKYFPRSTFIKLYNMFYQYGYFKPLVNLKLKKPASLRQFVPLLFVVYLFLGLFLPFMNFFAQGLYSLGLLIYFIANIYVSSKISAKSNSVNLLPYLFYSFFIIHFAYGYGYIRGIINFIILGKKNKHTRLSR